MSKKKARRGFTLIELAIVLVILGLLLGMGVGLVGMLTKRIKIREAREKIREAREVVNAAIDALIGHAMSRRCLVLGDNDPLQGFFSGTQFYQNAGIPRIKDSWGKFLYYIVAPEIAQGGKGGQCSSNKDICSQDGTSLILKVCKDAKCSSWDEEYHDIAFVIVSGGPNYNIQISPYNPILVYMPGIAVDGFKEDGNATGGFDDIVKWVTLNELKVKIGCQYLRKTLPKILPPRTFPKKLPIEKRD